MAKKLCEKSGMQTVFFCNSGAEANEGVIKAVRKYGFTKYQKTKIVSLENSFHGRTMAALSATGQPAYHQHFFPFVDGFVFAKANDLQDTLFKLTDDVCAVMMEVVQGEGGVIALDKEYVQTVVAHCQKHDILVIVHFLGISNMIYSQIWCLVPKAWAVVCPLVRCCLVKKQKIFCKKVTTVLHLVAILSFVQVQM